MKFNVDAPIWLSKQRILCSLNQSLKDVLNYGLFQPAYNGKAGKFLDEERQLREYPFPSIAPVPYLEVGMDHVSVWGYTWSYIPWAGMNKRSENGLYMLMMTKMMGGWIDFQIQNSSCWAKN